MTKRQIKGLIGKLLHGFSVAGAFALWPRRSVRSQGALDGTEQVLQALPDAQPQNSVSLALDQTHLLAVYGADFSIQNVNDLYCAAHEMPREQLIGLDVRTLMQAEISSTLEGSGILADLRKNTTVARVFTRRQASGKQLVIDALYVPLLDAQGHLKSIYFLGRDAAEPILRGGPTAQQGEQPAVVLQQLALNSSHLSVRLDKEWRVLDANAKFLQCFGYANLSELLGLIWDEVGQFSDRGAQQTEPTRQKLQALKNGQTLQTELHGLNQAGQTVCLLATFSPVFGGNGEIDSIIILALDVTAEKQDEERLRESKKLEAIGLLTGGLAHDFNNMLGIVLGNLDLMEEDLPQDKPLFIESFSAARQAAIRCASVASALLSVARRQSLDLAYTDINDLLGSMSGLLGSSVGPRLMMRSHLCAGALWATIDNSGLSNAVLNLVINARDALEAQDGPKVIDLSTERLQLGPDDPCGLAAGDYVMLSVKDNGPGMTGGVLERAFDPFFTTKEAGKGTGLGLAMVRGYAEQLGGQTRVITELGFGTTVQIVLPLAQAPAQQQTQAEAERLAALNVLNVLDTPPEQAFDALVQEAANLLEVPTALISLVDSKRQWFKAKVGLNADETPRSMAFCAHTIQTPNTLFEVPDAKADVRFSGNPLVTEEPRIRFYAGVPLLDAEGQALGTLCVIDYKPRQLSEAARAQLISLAARASSLLSARPQLAEPGASTDDVKPLRVLVVDDEEGLCRIACHWFTSLGLQASGCTSADEALARLQCEPFDLLFSDILMPGDLDGVALAEAGLAHFPGLKVVLTTGFAPSAYDLRNLPATLLKKPYRKADLAQLLAHLHALPPEAADHTTA